MSTLLGKAIALASDLFKDKTDKAGEPYILHCIRVMMNSPKDEVSQCIAILHDIVEDCGITEQDLLKMGFPFLVVNGISILSHIDPSMTYDDYIKRIARYPQLVPIKLADIKDNSDITRLKGITAKDIARTEKYHRSYMYLSKL